MWIVRFTNEIHHGWDPISKQLRHRRVVCQVFLSRQVAMDAQFCSPSGKIKYLENDHNTRARELCFPCGKIMHIHN